MPDVDFCWFFLSQSKHFLRGNWKTFQTRNILKQTSQDDFGQAGRVVTEIAFKRTNQE